MVNWVLIPYESYVCLLTKIFQNVLENFHSYNMWSGFFFEKVLNGKRLLSKYFKPILTPLRLSINRALTYCPKVIVKNISKTWRFERQNGISGFKKKIEIHPTCKAI